MSFTIWYEPPPFAFSPEDREQIHKVGAVWVVTDDPARATQAEVDAVRNAPAPAPAETVEDLKAALLAKGVLTKADIAAALSAKASA